MKMRFLLAALFLVLTFNIAHADDFQSEQQAISAQQQAVQQQEQALQQSMQQNVQNLMQAIQQWMQIVQQQEQTVQQNFNALDASRRTQANQTAMQQAQQAIQFDEQALQQSVNQLQQQGQTVIQNAQQNIQTQQQAISQVLNVQNFAPIAAIEAQIQQILQQEAADLQGIVDQGKALFAQHQNSVQDKLAAQATIGGGNSPSAVTGACGNADGQSFVSAPSVNLCNAGAATAVSGNGPFAWNCEGNNGGGNASCQAVKAVIPVNGACGPSNGQTVASAPSSGLCVSGNASAVSGDGPYGWSCAGKDGGSDVSCQASKAVTAVSGSCGSANGQSFGSLPTSGLCATGDVSSVAGSGPWTWLCNGNNGGDNVSCQASKTVQAVNGACGASNGQSFSAAPSGNLCSTGTASSVTGNGPFGWNCSGSNGGTNAQCQALLTPPAPVAVDGTCGASNGQSFTAAPNGNLCSNGTASSVTGNGPFAWNCSGSNGGANAQCQASLTPPVTVAVDGACGASSGQSFSAAPSGNLCSNGVASSVTGNGPFVWHCSGGNGGNTAQCQAALTTSSAAVNGACGPANGQILNIAPTTGLCSAGTASVSGAFDWTCEGSNGGGDISCLAIELPQQPVSGSCGSANGTSPSTKPSVQTSLCATGAPTTVTGSGPWAWSCKGISGGAQVSCATTDTPVIGNGSPINGACGSANGLVLDSAPAGNLCASGSASAVNGTAPWAWLCNGQNGGLTATCAAQSPTTDVWAECGAASSAVLSSAPSGALNLCANGMPSAVSGNGPWNWTCAIPASLVQPVVAGFHQYANCWAHSTTEGAYYVSTTGNDSNAGTVNSPFRTLLRAKQAMEQSNTVKTTYVRSGTYTETDPVFNNINNPGYVLSSIPGLATLWLHGPVQGADGTVLATDDGQAWLAYPGETPVLEGNNSTGYGIQAGVGNFVYSLTFRGFVVRNYTQSGIDYNAGSGSIIDNNEVSNINPINMTNGSSIYLHFAASNTVVSHNFVQGSANEGILVASGSVPEVPNNITIDHNLVANSCLGTQDCGGIYFLGRGHSSIGLRITNNIVNNVNHRGLTKGIYLDDEASKVLVQNNIVYGGGDYALQLHGSDYTVIQNNIFDVTEDAQGLGLYQDDYGSGFTNFGMAGNVFTHNIIYNNGAPQGKLWDYLDSAPTPIALPFDNGNLYYAANGSFANDNSFSTIVDTQPVFGNPGFANAGSHDYSLAANSQAAAVINFMAIDTSTVGRY